FRDDDEGYAVGEAGTILRTENGGNTWEKVQSPILTSFMRVDFADDKNGLIAGHGGTILRSSDKGRTWNRVDSNTKKSLYGLFVEKKYAWAVGADGLLLEYFR
ncbi:MAG: glycosyl hydrolase, partial [Acidobacteria bacterium]|nr:glycosyl hydrolase [Acidobacteriota bacterium]